MNVQRVAYFVAVAHAEHVTRAAEALGITQPALSRSIARLEAELGAPLFDRKGRSVRLNRHGRTLLTSAERAFAELDRARREIADQLDASRGTVALGFLHTLGIGLVPDLIGAYRRDAPYVTFDLVQNAADTIYRQLDDGAVDLCFGAEPPPQRGLVWRELYREAIELAVPPDHRLARRRGIRLAEVSGDAFVALRPPFSLRQLSDQLCARAGFAPQIAFEGEEVATVRGLVAAGLGVALLPVSPAPSAIDPPQLTIRAPRCYRRLGLAWRTDRFESEAARRFRAFVIARFAAGTPGAPLTAAPEIP
ncbi:MAG: LysR family transcriptional regulator [Vulcanimicrobiaceae bacterium]